MCDLLPKTEFISIVDGADWKPIYKWTVQVFCRIEDQKLNILYAIKALEDFLSYANNIFPTTW